MQLHVNQRHVDGTAFPAKCAGLLHEVHDRRLLCNTSQGRNAQGQRRVEMQGPDLQGSNDVVHRQHRTRIKPPVWARNPPGRCSRRRQ